MRILGAVIFVAFTIFFGTWGETMGWYTIPCVPRPLPLDLGVSLLGWLLGLLLIVGAAIVVHYWKKTELTPAAELVVVYGILGLLLSLIAAFNIAFPIMEAQKGQLNLAGLKPVLDRFKEGLISAGIAPVCAAIMRMIESSSATSHNPPDPRQLTYAFGQLETVIKSSSLAINNSANELAAAIKRIETSTVGLDKALAGKGDNIAKELNATLATLKEIAGSLRDIGRSSSTTSASLDELSKSAQTSQQLLATLEALIEQVTNFVRAQK